jgi:hypothetical protein
MPLLPYRDHTYFRLISTRTGETMFEAKMLHGSLIVWGAHWRPSEFDARLAEDGQTVALVGTLRDRIGPVVTFRECIDVRASYSVVVDDLPPDYDPAWNRDNT